MSESAKQGLSRRDFAALAVGGAVLAQTGTSALAQEASSAKAPLEPTRLVSAGETLRPEIVGSFGIVAAGRHYAVAAGTRILMAGGNATDAGVAAVFAAAVTEISHFGFGGEAPTIIYDAKAKKVSLVNGQGVAPMLATPDKFAKAGVIPGNGPNGGTVPAMVDAMALALQLNGTMTLDQVLQPAIELADGFVMYNFLAEVFVSQKKATSKWKDAYDTYYPGGALPKVGEIFRQPNLARTIRAIAAADRAAYKKTKNRKAAIQAGRDAFYKGDIARRIGAAMERDGGLMRYEDLARYKGKVETPTMTSVFGYEVYKGGFWSQGPAMLMALNIAEAAGIASMEPGSAPYLHIVAESIKLAFDDRNAFFGDPDFATVPMQGLLSKAYAAERAKQIGPKASLEHRYGGSVGVRRQGSHHARLHSPYAEGPAAPDRRHHRHRSGRQGRQSVQRHAQFGLAAGRRLYCGRYRRADEQPAHRLRSRSGKPQCAGAGQAAAHDAFSLHGAEGRGALSGDRHARR